MPGVRDKIIINDSQFEAGAQTMRKALEAAQLLATEAEHAGKQKECHQAFTAKQEAVCEKLDKAVNKAVADQWALVDEMRRWLDGELGLN